MATQNGTDIILMVDGERFAAATANEISLTRAMRDVTNKDSGSWKENEYGLSEGSMNGTGLFLTDSVNLLAFTEDFSNSWWEKTGLTIGAKVIGPNGLKNATEITGLGDGNGNALSSQILSINPSSPFVFSIYVKGSGHVEISTGDEAVISVEVVSLTSDWKRVVLQSSTASGEGIFAAIVDDNAASLQVYGPQLEYGEEPTAYKPSGKGYSYLSSALINKTKVQCILTNQVDYKLTGECLVSNLTLTAPMEENVTFTADFSLSGLINEGTI